MKTSVMIFASVLFALLHSNARAQKSGQSISITYGKVTASRDVQEQSNAAKGALVGGTIGYAASNRKSSSQKRKGAAMGATTGALAANKAQGDRSAKEYTVQTHAGITVIISDQTEIIVGDCVVVENPGSNQANIRRVTQTYCESESAEIVSELAEEMMEEAEECLAAKKQLAAAESEAEFDRTIRKVEILCNS